MERDVREPLASTEPSGSDDVGCEVAVTQPEPRFLSEPAELLDDVPGLALDAPAERAVGDARQGVENRVVIGTHEEPVTLEIVAGVDDDRQVRPEDPLKPEGQLGAADAA